MKNVRLRRAALAVAVLALALPAAAPAAPPPFADDFRYFPPDADVVFAVQMDKLLASDGAQKLRKDIPDFNKGLDSFRKEFGVAPTDIERFGGGGRVKDTGLLVLHTKKALKAADVLAAIKEPRFEGDKPREYKEAKVGKATLFEPMQGHQAVALADEHTLLQGEAKDVRTALERVAKPGKAEPSAGMRKALDQVDQTATVFFAFDLKAVTAADPNALPEMGPGGVNPRKALAEAEALAGSVTVGADINLRGAAVCKDAKAAAALKAEVEKGLAGIAMMLKEAKGAPKELLDVPGMVKLTVEGNVLRSALTVKSDVAVAGIKALFLGGPK